MGFWDLFKKKDQYDPRYNHVLTAEDRMEAAEGRRLQREIRRQEQELRLAELKLDSQLRRKELEMRIAELDMEMQEMNGEEGNDLITQLAMPFVQKIISQSQGAAVNNVNQVIDNSSGNPPVAALRDINQKDLEDMWNKTPKAAKIFASTASDDMVLDQLHKLLPSCTPETYERAFKIVKGIKE